jgi:hypothetical protein
MLGRGVGKKRMQFLKLIKGYKIKKRAEGRGLEYPERVQRENGENLEKEEIIM